MEINIRIFFSKGGQKLRKKIGGGNRGNAQVDYALWRFRETLQKVVPDVKDPDRALIKLISLCGDSYLFCSTDDQLCAQFFFKRADMGTDRRLCKIQPPGRFRKAAVIYNCRKGL